MEGDRPGAPGWLVALLYGIPQSRLWCWHHSPQLGVDGHIFLGVESHAPFLALAAVCHPHLLVGISQLFSGTAISDCAISGTLASWPLHASIATLPAWQYHALTNGT